jgi:hypothetical protein
VSLLPHRFAKSFNILRKERSMFLAQKNQKPTVPVAEEEKSFISIPRPESVYCEDCDTISVRTGAA